MANAGALLFGQAVSISSLSSPPAGFLRQAQVSLESPRTVASVPPMPRPLGRPMTPSWCSPTSNVFGASDGFSVARPGSQPQLISAERDCFRAKAMGRMRTRLGKRGTKGGQADRRARALLHGHHVPPQPRTLSYRCCRDHRPSSMSLRHPVNTQGPPARTGAPALCVHPTSGADT